MAKCFINHQGTKAYYNDDDVIHREDGPAIITLSGRVVWCHTERWHREDGPAWDLSNGYKRWYNKDKKTWPKL